MIYPMIYLDYHASHPMLPVVQQAVVAEAQRWGNPSSVHQTGQALQRDIDGVRQRLAMAVGMPGARVIFTSGATEASAMILSGAGSGAAVSLQHRIVLAAAHEHAATLAYVPDIQRLRLNHQGFLDTDLLQQRLRTLASDKVAPKNTVLVSCTIANNETGITQPISRISRVVHQHGGLLHVDAVQGFGRMAIDMRLMGIDILTLSAHKVGGPPGVGAVIMPQALSLEPLIKGGGQERGWRGGTENWLGILAWGAALDWWAEHAEAVQTHLRDLDQHLADRLRDHSQVIWLGHDYPRVPGCALLLCADQEAQNLLIQLDLAGIAVSSGSACSSGRVGHSHVLVAMEVEPALAASALRVSYGHATTKGELDQFVDHYLRIIGR